MMLQNLEVEQRRRSCKQIKSNYHQNSALHCQDIFSCISTITNENQVFQLRNLICFLVFGSNPQSSDPKQLKLISLQVLFVQKRIDNFHCQEESFSHQFIFHIHLHQPVEEDSSHVLSKIFLELKVPSQLRSRLTTPKKILLNVQAIDFFLLRGRRRQFEGVIEDECWYLVIVFYIFLLILRLDMSSSAKFHSKQQRINNEMENTNINIQQSAKNKIKQVLSNTIFSAKHHPQHQPMFHQAQQVKAKVVKKQQPQQEQRKNLNYPRYLSLQAVQINKTLPIEPTNFYQERYEWLSRTNDYTLISTQQILQEQQYLRKELEEINEQASRFSQKKQMKPLIRSRQVNLIDRNNNNRDRQLQNNNAIIYRLRLELEQLQKRAYSSVSTDKEEVVNLFVELKGKKEKLKLKIKQLKMKSKNLGDNIENGEDIFTEVQKMENERDVQIRKKSKLQEKYQTSQAEVQRLEEKMQKINEDYIYAESFMEDQVLFDRQSEEQRLLENIHRQKTYQIEIMRKTIESNKNTKQQKYHQLLKVLQGDVQKGKRLDLKMSKSEIKQLYQKKQIMELQQALNQIMKIYLQRSKTSDIMQHQAAFFTGLDSDNILERQNSQKNDFNRKQLSLIRKPPTPNRFYKKDNGFSIDNIREEERRKQFSHRVKYQKLDLPHNKTTDLKNNRNTSMAEYTSQKEQKQKMQINNIVELPSANRISYYRNLKSLTQEKNQLLSDLSNQMPTIDEKPSTVQMKDESPEHSPIKYNKDDCKQLNNGYIQIEKNKVTTEQQQMLTEVKQNNEASLNNESNQIQQDNNIINKKGNILKQEDKQINEVDHKKHIISNYASQFQESEDQQIEECHNETQITKQT